MRRREFIAALVGSRRGFIRREPSDKKRFQGFAFSHSIPEHCIEFIINLKTAKALGVTISPSLLGRADEVIE